MASHGAGPLRHTIRLESRSLVQDGFGEVKNAWAPFAKVRAALEMLKGADVAVSSGFTQNRVTTRFRIRYLPGVVPSMRIIWNGEDEQGERVYHIKFVNRVDGRRAWLMLLAEELVGTAP